jgi:hypothetical protein
MDGFFTPGFLGSPRNLHHENFPAHHRWLSGPSDGADGPLRPQFLVATLSVVCLGKDENRFDHVATRLKVFLCCIG